MIRRDCIANIRFMIRSYFKVTYRNLLRQKSFAFINIFGLAIGLACSILIGLYVNHEYSYDKFNHHYDRLYRVMLDFKMGTNTMSGPLSPAPMATEILRQLPEIETAVRIRHQGNNAVRTDNGTFYVEKFFFADSNFFEIFNVHFISGDPKTALIRPYTVVITEQTSKNLFGTTNSVGNSFRITNGDSTLYEVTGVVKQFPSNAHFHFDMLASMSGCADSKVLMWLGNNYYTYVRLKEGTNVKELGTKLTELFAKNASPQVVKFFNISIEDFIKAGNKSNYGLQKVTDIHLKSNLNYEIEPNGNQLYVSIFILIAIFVLLNACINFTNLTTARSANRAKEVGLRKVLGSDRKDLIIQFIAESVVISYIAVLMALLIVELLLPQFNKLLNVNLNLSLSGYLKLFPFAILFATLVGIVSGTYPAFYLSAFNPEKVLKNKFLQGSKRNWLRNILVITQFTVSVVILLCTMLVTSQLKFIQDKNLGFDKDKLLIIERTNPIRNNMKVFIDELRKCSAIEEVSLSDAVPVRQFGDAGYTLNDGNSKDIFLINRYSVNNHYQKTMGIQMKEGRFFSEEFPTDSSAVVINEATARYLGLKDPLGKEIWSSGQGDNKEKHKIIGVMDDFHYESLHRPVSPLLLHLSKDYYAGYVNIRIKEGKENDVFEFVNLTWKNLAPETSLQYFFFNDQFDKMYKKEIETRRLMNVFAIIAILIAALGLFGLVAYLAEKRTKEIGVRKVLGSSVWEIIQLMTKDVTVLVILSYVIAAPFAYWWMNHWLTQFAFKTPVHLFIFIVALIIAMLVAWLTVIAIAVKAATRNPIESLRYE